MNPPMHLTRKLVWLLSLPLIGSCGGPPQKATPRPSDYDLERIVGNQLEEPIRVAAWAAPEPQQTNLFIYSVLLPQLDEDLMRRVATHFGVKGEIEQIRGDTLGHIGYWIRNTDPANPKANREIKYWLSISSFTYGTGDNGYRYNKETKRHEEYHVPDKESCKANAAELLPLLGLSTNDFECHPDGRLQWYSGESTISYNDKSSGQRRKVVIQRSVHLNQRVPGGGVTCGVGDGGKLRIDFVTEGKISGIEWFFRKMKKAGEAKPKSSKDIMRDLRKRNAWTWHQSAPTSMTVTNCVLAYPQGNSWLDQDYVWPFFMVTGTNNDGRATTLYVPL